MALYRMLFGKKFSSSLLKNRKFVVVFLCFYCTPVQRDILTSPVFREGQLFVEYGTAVEAISQVFPTLHMPFSRDRESLSPRACVVGARRIPHGTHAWSL